MPEFESNPLTSEDIDISHPLPSERKDGKNVAVCRFISRKSKFRLLEAKKNNRELKYKGHLVYINDHLSKENRKLFAAAAEKKRELGYKFLWTRQAAIFLRKDEHSEVLRIDSIEKLRTIVN